MLTPSVRLVFHAGRGPRRQRRLHRRTSLRAGRKPAPATPQAALDALEAAIAAGDARAAMALLTPDGQKRLAKDAVMGSLAMLAFTDPDDPNPMGPKPAAAELATKKKAYTEAKTAITAALKPSGHGRRDRQAADAGHGDRGRQDRRGRRGDAGARAVGCRRQGRARPSA